MRSLILLLFISVSPFLAIAQTPVLSSFSPAGAYIGDTITLNGSGFNTTPSANIVMFGNARATVVSATANQVRALLPIGATSQSITILNTASNLCAYRNVGVTTLYLCANSLSAASFGARTFPGSNLNRGYSTANGDLDLDGKPDLVAGSYVGGGPPSYVHFFRNTSTGPGNASFTQVDSILTFGGLYAVAVVDLDNDGKPDVIAASAGTNFSVYRNISPGPGTILFAPKVNFSYASTSFWALSFADMDGDGKTDIVVGGHSTTGISILPNTSTPGTISFGAKFVVPVSTPGSANLTDSKAADLDLDGKPDIVFASYNTGAVGIVRNTSTPGSFSFDPGFYLNVAATGQTHGVAVGDLNGDGRPDLFGVNRNMSTMSVWENISSPGSLSTGSFGSRIDLSGAGSTALIEDVTGDGRPELVFSNGGGLRACHNQHLSGPLSTASFATSVIWSLYCGGTARMFTLGDWDADGMLDIASAQDATPGVVDVSLRQSTPGFLAPVAVTRTGITATCDDGTWEYVYDPNDPDRILVAVRDNGLSLGILTSDAYVEASTYLTFGSQFALRRHFVINPASDPAGTKRVRLYFTQTEFDDLNTADPSISALSHLAVFKYDGSNEDGVYDLSGGTLITIPPASITTGSGFGGLYLEFDVSGFSEFWIGSAANPLPLQWLSFTGTPSGADINLEWEVADAEGIAQFHILRSSDSKSFSEIGSVNAGASPHYSFSDEKAALTSGTWYYQLISVDAGGNESRSSIIQVKVTRGDLACSLYPNPGNETLHFEIELQQDAELQLVFTDLSGRTVFQSAREWKEAGMHSLSFSLPELEAGLYWITVLSGSEKKTLPWVKQH